MYEQCFNLHSRPFTATPFVKHYFAAESIQQSLANARQAIDRGTGPVVVIGPTGTGKSLLMAMLEEQYRTQFSVVNLACARLDDRKELLQNILFELQLPYREMSEGELRLSLMDFLKPSEACETGILLLVDEAHMLPVELLDEIRLITNYVKDGEPRVRLAMAGNQRLEDSLANPKLESFNQRIAARCYLTKMSQQETAEYVVTHIDRAGGDGRQLFTETSLRKIHELSDGCPRFVNQISEQTMVLGSTRGICELDEGIVAEAWRDVQSLPGSDPAESFDSDQLADNENWTVIEFGNLTDDEIGPEENIPVEATVLLDEPEYEPIGNVESNERQDSNESITNNEYQETEFSDDEFRRPEPTVPLETVIEFSDDSFRSPQPTVPLETVLQNNDTSDSSSDDETEFADESSVSETLSFDSDDYDAATFSDEPNPAPGTTCEDPFAEEFSEEEEIVDQYAALVAAQNQSSLAVTTDDIELIHPMADADLSQVSATVDAIDGDVADELVEASESESDVNDETEYHQHLTQATSKDIERQAEEILKSVSLGLSTVSHETESDQDLDSVSNTEMPTTSSTESPGELAAGLETEEGILESQRMLQQIIQENNRSATSAFPSTASVDDKSASDGVLVDETPPISNEPEMGQRQESDDDKDMIVVSRKDEVDTPTPEASPEESIPFPATAVSTGKAERMDYQQLFEQLRNISDD